MDIFSKTYELKEKLATYKKKGMSIGFVPTMGALHQGHLSLVDASKKSTDITVVSIFVNPTQFNNPDDLEKYPRDVNSDCKLLEDMNCDIVFAPLASEIYPEKDERTFNFEGLDSYMEGAFRPGHFNGVAQVVSILFDIVTPDKAFFGEKDFQQLAIIKFLTKNILKTNKPEIVPCPIYREENGLAMSSRNERLTPEQRENASIIAKTIFEATKLTDKMSVEELKIWATEQINANPLFEVEYFDLVNNNTLQPISEWGDKKDIQGCIAVFAGDIRLIDNVRF